MTSATINPATTKPSLFELVSSSLVWQGRNLNNVGIGSDREVLRFELAPGNWILIAKAEIRASGPFTCDVQLTLEATEGSRRDEDRSKARVGNFGYQTVPLMLGTSVAHSGEVKLHVLIQAASGDDLAAAADLDHIVVSAIKVDRLIVGSL